MYCMSIVMFLTVYFPCAAEADASAILTDDSSVSDVSDDSTESLNEITDEATDDDVSESNVGPLDETNDEVAGNDSSPESVGSMKEAYDEVIGDEVPDDSAAIQMAIDDAASVEGDGDVIFPAGTYLVEDILVLKSDITLTLDSNVSQRVDIHYKFIGYLPLGEILANSNSINGIQTAEIIGQMRRNSA